MRLERKYHYTICSLSYLLGVHVFHPKGWVTRKGELGSPPNFLSLSKKKKTQSKGLMKPIFAAFLRGREMGMNFRLLNFAELNRSNSSKLTKVQFKIFLLKGTQIIGLCLSLNISCYWRILCVNTVTKSTN